MQSDGLGEQILFQSLVCLRLECREVFEHSGHIAALIEEHLAVLLRRDGEREVVAVDGNRTFALVAVGREALQVDHVVSGEYLAAIQPVEQFFVIGQHRLDLRRIVIFEPQRAILLIPVDPRIVVSPQRAEDHQKMHQVEAGGKAVRRLEYPARRVALLSLPPMIGWRYRWIGRMPTVSERIRTQAQTAVSASEDSGVMAGLLVLSAINALLTAFSNSSESIRLSSRGILFVLSANIRCG